MGRVVDRPNLLDTNIQHKVTPQVDAGERGTAPDPAGARPVWLRLAIPSVSDLVFVLLLLALTCGALAKGLLGDAGIGWHIRTGELILETHAVPRVDSFSSVMHGQPWYAWEWLYDVKVGYLHGAAGLNGVVAYSAFIIALTFALLNRMMLARGAHLPVAVLFLLLTLSASTIHFLARPHLFSWLFVVAWFGVLEKFDTDGNRRWLAWLPVTVLLWVNVHGGFLLGLVLLGIYFASAVLTAWTSGMDAGRKAALRRARVLVIAGVVSAAATFANPYGYKLHVHIYRYLGDRFLMNHIDEFLSPNFHGLPQKCFAVLVLIAVAAAAGSRKRVRLSQLLVMLFAIYSGVYASRNIPTSAILLALIVAPQVSGMLREMADDPDAREGWRRKLVRFDRFSTRMSAFDGGLAGHLWAAVALVLLIWACAHHGRVGGAQVMDARFDQTRFPVKAADVLAADAGGEAVFCPDRWGGYLVYRLYPKTLVAVDDRHDLYGPEFLERYLKIVHGEPGWDSDLVGMHPDWVLVPADSTVVSLLEGRGEWRVAYQDSVAVLFRR